MRLLVTGALGAVGRTVMTAFPDSVGLDIRPGTDITADLGTIDYNDPRIVTALTNVDALVHLGTSPNPKAADEVHWQAVSNCARLLQAAQRMQVKNVVLASSNWAEPINPAMIINAYGDSKRVFEQLAAMYDHGEGQRAVALRIGWVPHSPDQYTKAEQWLKDNFWSGERLIDEMRRALGLADGQHKTANS
ncbi:NAD(P)-dependent oxidoreductase [Devosia rhodophyticola]|uniref:NAD(P)-dependent oxidoreductase n=1 Tax=Devosia rhodophyticola TaxID=3026423 RepID=A0ABY7YTN9_9HYPH|nr:NAD(P)-dependent oxidoreductase [Devosia rhodophyticola]WDR04577.1 NAD(P)-dependent oxidoreductase [Devosia rhodophyticola]